LALVMLWYLRVCGVRVVDQHVRGGNTPDRSTPLQVNTTPPKLRPDGGGKSTVAGDNKSPVFTLTIL